MHGGKLLVLSYTGRDVPMTRCLLPWSVWVFLFSTSSAPEKVSQILKSLPTALNDIAHACRITCVFIAFLQYDKEIKVINTATAECSVPSKRRVDLPITAGEQLDVIDVTEGNTVICRNLEGRCKFAQSLWHWWPLCNLVLKSKQQYVLCA